MTASYGPLAAWYDALTRDVDYAAFADYYERIFSTAGGEMRTLLDLCCGTGTLTCLLAERGYEMIAADASPDMLMQAREKASRLPADRVQPLLLCQSAAELDLYGTVDAAVCSLDGFDYLQRRLHGFGADGATVDEEILTAAVAPAVSRVVTISRPRICPRCCAVCACSSARAGC